MTKNIFRFIAGILLTFSLWSPASAQDSLTIEDCRAQAIAYNKLLKVASHQKGEAEAYSKVAKTAYLPSVSAQASVMFSPRDINISLPEGAYMATAVSEEAAQNGDFNGVAYAPGMDILNVNNLSVINGGFSVTQPIYAGGKIRYSQKKAELGVVMAENNYNLQFDEVIELSDKLFWQVATVEANIKLAESYIEMLNDLEDQMNRMYELGLTPQSEKLKVSVQKNDAELNLLKARNGLIIAKMYLNQVLGRDLSTPVNIKYDISNLNLLDKTGGIDQALANRSELKLVQNQLDMAAYDKKIALADYLPTIGVSAQYSTFYVNDIYDDLDFTTLVSGQIKIPIFAWGQGKQKQKAADFVLKQKQEELSRTSDLISLEVMQVKVQMEESYQQILLSRKSVKEAEENLEETKSSFSVGLNTTTDLLNAQADWQNAKTGLITAIANYKLLETSWYKVTGTLMR